MSGGIILTGLTALIALASDAIAERIIAWGRPPYWPETGDDPRPAQLLAGDLAPVDFVEMAATRENRGEGLLERAAAFTNGASHKRHEGGL